MTCEGLPRLVGPLHVSQCGRPCVRIASIRRGSSVRKVASGLDPKTGLSLALWERSGIGTYHIRRSSSRKRGPSARTRENRCSDSAARCNRAG